MNATQDRPAPRLEGVASTALALREGRLTPEQIDLLKKTVAKGASDDEFALFIELCNHTGLNPFARQIYCLQRRTNVDGQWVNAMVPQTGIDGFRLVAERTGKYRGQTAPVFFDKGGHEREVWLDPKVPPTACKVGVLKTGFDAPLFGIALYEEFVQRTKSGEPNRMWKEKPTVMLAKCAEAMALRKAFPQELSGIYSEDEIPAELVDEGARPSIETHGTRARIAGETMSAKVSDDGEVELTFGAHKGKKLSTLPTSYLLETFREPWKDEERKRTAVERLGAGFVNTVYAELLKRNVPADCTVAIAKLDERVRAGEVLSGEEAEQLRDWFLDHPVAEEPAS